MMAQTIRCGHAKGCTFLGIFHIASLLQKPQNPQFWGVNGRFQNLRNRKRAYCQNYCIDSNQILHSDKDHQMPFVGGPHTHITNPRWRTATTLKMEKSPYLGRCLTDFDESWHDDAGRPS